MRTSPRHELSSQIGLLSVFLIGVPPAIVSIRLRRLPPQAGHDDVASLAPYSVDAGIRFGGSGINVDDGGQAELLRSLALRLSDRQAAAAALFFRARRVYGCTAEGA